MMVRSGMILWLITVAALVLGLIYTKRPLPAPTAPPPAGRYQLMSDPKSGYLFLLDTATGRAWKFYSEQWSDGQSPAVDAK